MNVEERLGQKVVRNVCEENLPRRVPRVHQVLDVLAAAAPLAAAEVLSAVRRVERLRRAGGELPREVPVVHFREDPRRHFASLLRLQCRQDYLSVHRSKRLLGVAFAREDDHIIGAADARTDQIAREELAIDPGLKEAIVLET